MMVGLLPLTISCRLLTPLAFVVQHQTKVSPEFDKLPGRRVAILVWTDPSTLFDYPHARFELATYISSKLNRASTDQELAVDVVDSRDVEDLLQRNLDARIDPRIVGRSFDVDYVINVEVLRFQFRDPQQPQFLQGKIDASVWVHDTRTDPDELRRYELTPVACAYPEGMPVILTATNSPHVREATYEKFAGLVARKFHEYVLE